MTGLAQVNKGKGYTTELIVPWAQLGVSKPAKGQQYDPLSAHLRGDIRPQPGW
jgi:hypothetical protein